MNQADFQADNPYASFGGVSVADAPADTRASFIRKTYIHLTMAIYGCVALCWALFQTGFAEQVAGMMLGNGQIGWLVVLGGFMLVSWVANSWAQSNTSIGLQYAGLSLYVVAEAIFLCPLLWVAQWYTLQVPGAGEVNVIAAAGVSTLVMFAGLTAIAWFSKADFSFLGWGLGLVGFAAIGLIGCSWLFGFSLGVWFTVAMIVFASAYILYDTSNVIHRYREGQHVAASLALFASVALLFWYILQLLMSLSSRD